MANVTDDGVSNPQVICANRSEEFPIKMDLQEYKLKAQQLEWFYHQEV